MSDSTFIKKGYSHILVQAVVPNVPTKIYTAQGPTTHITTFTVCNLLWAPWTLSLGIALNGDAINQNKQFIYKDVIFSNNNTLGTDLEICLKAWDSIFVSAGLANNFAITISGSDEAYNGVNI